MSHFTDIANNLELLDAAPVECDGMARLVVTELARQGESYQVYLGKVSSAAGQIFGPHYWTVWRGHVVDFRARMWLGETAPHGINSLATVADLYNGMPVDMAPLPSSLEAILKIDFA